MPLSVNCWATWRSDSPGMISTSTAWAPMGKGSRVQCQCSQTPPPTAANSTMSESKDERFTASILFRPAPGKLCHGTYPVTARTDAVHRPDAGDGVAHEYFLLTHEFRQG